MHNTENDGTVNKVSILIASLREEELKKRLEEYDNIQININYEIVVVSPFEVVHPKVKWVKEEERKGNVYAMQKAFNNSTGNYIMFLADDVSPTISSIDNLFHFVRMRGEPFLGSFIMTDEQGKEQDSWYIKDKLYACYGCIARKDIEK
jgi:GT2 family glycosyltransferase